MSRFDYIKYDEKACNDQAIAKNLATTIESFITCSFKPSRAQALALTRLEEAYMWIGKMIRDEQIERNKTFTSQEERSNS